MRAKDSFDRFKFTVRIWRNAVFRRHAASIASNVSIIIPAQNDAGTIGAVLQEAAGLFPMEIVVVLHGCADRTRWKLRTFPCVVVECTDPLDGDAGRAIGAYYAKGDVLLFLGGNFPVARSELIPLIQSVQQGCDVALNHLAWLQGSPERLSIASVVEQATNHMLGRSDLGANSILHVPYALSRKAVGTIGWSNLAHPVLAHAIAIEQGLALLAPVAVSVASDHAKYPESSDAAAANLTVGDHIEAIRYFIGQRGFRGGFSEGIRSRNRHMADWIVPRPSGVRANRSAVIPVSEEQQTISGVIRSVRDAGVDEIIVVANGADESTIRQAEDLGAIVVSFPERLGHNVGRAIGAVYSTGDICLFVDGDFVIPPEDLFPYIAAAENGTDIALNDLEAVMDWGSWIHPVNAIKYFLNLALRRGDLMNNSMTAIPFAMRRNVMEAIGFSSMVIPPYAQAKAIMMGFDPRAVHYTNVVDTNRLRPEHKYVEGRMPALDRLLGDHVEALEYLISQTDARGGFGGGGRDRSAFELLQLMMNDRIRIRRLFRR